MLVCNCAAVLVITGVGLTVIVTGIELPLQPFAEGVTVYDAVPLVNPSVLVNDCMILAPLPLVAPLTLTGITVHV